MTKAVLSPFKTSLTKPEAKLPDPMNVGVRLNLFDWTCESTKASLVGEREDQKVYINVMYCGKRKPDKAIKWTEKRVNK